MTFDYLHAFGFFDLKNWFYYAFAFVAVTSFLGQFLFTLDDLFVDLCSYLLNLKPKSLSATDVENLKRIPQKRIAIMVANWHEDEILSQIVSGNVEQIEYSEYSFFLGVYPNDQKTWEVANRLSSLYPDKVHVIVNSLPGPTSKGQMLNEIVRKIISSEDNGLPPYDIFMLHDSEDVIHPLSLHLVNEAAVKAQFIQLPVFSFDLEISRWVGGTYIEEFGESHTKDLLVREKLGAAIPSAGVGTAMTRDLVIGMIHSNGGKLLKEDTLTEDYHLGLTSKILGFQSRFICSYISNKDQTKEIIATREYFPNNFWNSVRQKTRWTLGIVFQGKDNLGWSGSVVDRYFLLRDRKGPWNFVLFVLGTMTLLGFLIAMVFDLRVHPVLVSTPFLTLALINMMSMCLRLFQRMRAVQFVYSNWQQTLMVPLRWPIGNVINGIAAYRAFRTYLAHRDSATAIPWVKTTHEIPQNFGKTIESADVVEKIDQKQPREVMT